MPQITIAISDKALQRAKDATGLTGIELLEWLKKRLKSYVQAKEIQKIENAAVDSVKQFDFDEV